MSRDWVGQLSAMRTNTLFPMAIVIQTGCRESQDMRGRLQVTPSLYLTVLEVLAGNDCTNPESQTA
jgi:hypothetical protein